MKKRQIISSLNNIANTLDNSGLYKEANSLTNVMIKLADEFREDYEPDPDTRYAPERYKDEILKLMNQSGDVLPFDKEEVLMTLLDYLKTDNKRSYLEQEEEKHELGRPISPKDKLKLDLMRFTEKFFQEMNLEEMDYKYLIETVEELM